MSDTQRARPHARQLRRRSADDDEDGEGEEESVARLEALRNMQRLRGTRQYRTTQLDVLRRTDDPTNTTPAAAAPTAQQAADPQDITDHSKQMFVLSSSSTLLHFHFERNNIKQGRVYRSETARET